MNKLAKVLGIAGGVAAVIWAIRDRFITVTAPREPEPPTFRVVTPPLRTPAPPAGADGSDDLTAIKGGGPVTAGRLREAGIGTVEALVGADPDALAAATGLAADRIRTWQETAAGIA